MTINDFKCPECNAVFPLDEALVQQLIQPLSQQFETESTKLKASIRAREEELKNLADAVAAEKAGVEETVKSRIEEQRSAIAAEEAEKARTAIGVEVTDLQTQLKDATGRAKKAEEAELALRQANRKLEEDKEGWELEKQRQLDAERTSIRESAQRDTSEQFRLKESEYNQRIEAMKKLNDELQRKLDQGSEQAHGEVQELDLEQLLRDHYPDDEIIPVPKGQHGGDVLHRVRTRAGVHCGTILWEAKRTKNWTENWLPKLRNDQRASKAELAVLMTTKMPKDRDLFCCVDSVWVTDPVCAMHLANLLRHHLLEVALIRQNEEGRQEKADKIYGYLVSPQFKQRVDGLLEPLAFMTKQLESERTAMQSHWAKREMQIKLAVGSLAGFYGDVQAIAGQSLPEIEAFEHEPQAVEPRAIVGIEELPIASDVVFSTNGSSDD